MAGSVNKVILVGNLGKDPEIRNTQSGAKIANFTLATSKTWNDKQSGERKEQTEWHRVVCFNDHLTGVIERFVKKGTKLYIEGELKTRKWTDQSGQDRYTTEVVIDKFKGEITILSSKGDGQGEGSSSGNNQQSSSAVSNNSGNNASSGNGWGGSSDNSGSGWGGDDLDDEIPF